MSRALVKVSHWMHFPVLDVLFPPFAPEPTTLLVALPLMNGIMMLAEYHFSLAAVTLKLETPASLQSEAHALASALYCV